MATRALAARARFDCHSNKTVWSPYAWVAPASWLVQCDVDRVRRALNVSEWGRTRRREGDAAEAVLSGAMPPPDYAVPLSRGA